MTIVANPATEAQQRLGPKGESGRLRLLVCHDEPALQRAVSVAADRAGFRVIGVANSGADAVAAAARDRPDVAVLDVALTGVVGLALVARFAQAAPSCRVIVLSPFDKLGEAVQQWGGYDMVLTSDMRKLGHSLTQLHVSIHGGCTCMEKP